MHPVDTEDAQRGITDRVMLAVEAAPAVWPAWGRSLKGPGLVVEIIPLWLVNLLSFLTVFSVMASIGTTVTMSMCLEYLRSPSLLARGIASVLVIVPIIGIAASFVCGLDLTEKVAIALMMMAPGAPLALRRALGSGANASFAPTLQVVVVLLAVPALPLWVLIGNAILGTKGIADPGSVAEQVFLAQLLPLAVGALVRKAVPIRGPWAGRMLGHVGAVLLIVAITSIVVDLPYSVVATHPRPIVVALITTIAALIVGHLMGGQLPDARHSIAIIGAMRNVGLALLIATLNRTPPAVSVIIISYGIAAILIVTIYILWWTKVARGPVVRQPR
jgi:predicted Na+-dependent transporter